MGAWLIMDNDNGDIFLVLPHYARQLGIDMASDLTSYTKESA
jgi:hypothetical protein